MQTETVPEFRVGPKEHLHPDRSPSEISARTARPTGLLQILCGNAFSDEKGRVKPGDIVVGSDSHTCAYGALGAFFTGIGSTDMAYVLKFGELYFRVPDTIQINANGKFQNRVGPKDLILTLAAG